MSLTWAPCRVREPGGSPGAGGTISGEEPSPPPPDPPPLQLQQGEGPEPGMSQSTSGHRSPSCLTDQETGLDRGGPSKGGEATLPGKEGQEPPTSLLRPDSRHYVFCFPTSFLKNWSSLLLPSPPLLPPFPQILERLPRARRARRARRFLSVYPLSPSTAAASAGQVSRQQGSRSGRLTLPRSCVHPGPVSRVAPACQSRAPGAQSGSLAGMVIGRVGTR